MAPIEQSRRLVAALRVAAVAVEYVKLDNAGHDNLTWERVGLPTLAFLDRHLRSGV